MELICGKEDLVYGVQTVEKIVATRSTLPIIGNILFQATKSGLKLSANNLEMAIEVAIPAKVEKEGSILVPAKILSGIVTKLPNAEIKIKVSEKGLVKLSYKQSSFNIHGLPADEFPSLPKLKDPISFAIEAAALAEMIEQVGFAVSTSEEKYVLNGVLLEIGKTKVAGDTSNVRLIATDGYRLAKRGAKLAGITGESAVIIPGKALNELLRMISGEAKGEVKVQITSEQVSFKYEEVYLVSRLIHGQFPDYKQVIPKSSETKMTVNTKALLEASERTAVIASSNANIIKMELREGKLHLIASAPEVGNADEIVDAEVKGTDKAQVAFNVRLIVDALKVIDEAKVQLDVSGPLSPGVLKPIDGQDYLYIVMPIRTQDAAM